MKKLLTFILCALLVMTVFLMTGCRKKDSAIKFGTGTYISVPAVTDASADKDGNGSVDITFAAVSVDINGRITACAVDTMSNSVTYTADGKAVANDEFKTQHEIGADYGMVKYGGAAKEWYEQADAFESVVVGKTLDEVKALIADGNKGNEEVIAAGCTVAVNEFIFAIEDACNSTADSNITDKDKLKVTAFTEQVCTDASNDKDGNNKVTTTVFAAALDADGKVVAASSDSIEVDFTFDIKGISTFDTAKPIISKKDQGTDYGMVAYGGATKEWFEQAAEFDAACIGKSGSEISELVGNDGKGSKELQNAGCTITLTPFVKAASKIGQ